MDRGENENLGGHESIAHTAVMVMGSRGDYDRFRELLRRRLTDCGWSDQVRMMCRETVKDKGTSVTVDQLLEDVSPRARSIIPTTVKRELLQKVKEYLLHQANYYGKDVEMEAEELQ